MDNYEFKVGDLVLFKATEGMRNWRGDLEGSVGRVYVIAGYELLVLWEGFHNGHDGYGLLRGIVDNADDVDGCWWVGKDEVELFSEIEANE